MVGITLTIVDRVKLYVDGTSTAQAFRESCLAEAEKIGAGSFGAPFLSAIGFALEIEAEEFLGFQKSFLGLDGHAARAKKRVNSVHESLSIAGAGIKAFNTGRLAQKDFSQLEKEQNVKFGGNGGLIAGPSNSSAPPVASAPASAPAPASVPAPIPEDGEVSPTPAPKRERTESEEKESNELMASKLEESLPVILNLAWAINVRDISKSLKNASKKLYCDSDVPKEERIKRAEAVRILGSAFLAVGVKLGGAAAIKNVQSEDIKGRAEVAVMTTMAKAQGQEVETEDAEEMIKEAKRMKCEQKEAEGLAKAAAMGGGEGGGEKKKSSSE